MLEEICGQILFEILIFGIISILIDAGMSESEAKFTLFSTGFIFLIIFFIRSRTRGEALGKAVELDTEGDGRISEKGWDAAGMSNEKEKEREEEDNWWGPDEKEE